MGHLSFLFASFAIRDRRRVLRRCQLMLLRQHSPRTTA
ncbi:hypothetical protein RB6784 [Rhodopirellula baltica SH 1]|uniref:Uncharacterized protein n=1 Tax=Rhodopirellula baltica (strain DSM 10527 / NCIMB 13988 / SH1) TaxID=243090 RepID=Q7UPQ5_RHOBA|nr:hypothetical protein RB6784 [Rhodopirellula baltica SH 1]